MFPAFFMLIMFVNVTSINHLLHCKSFPLFKAICFFFCVSFAVFFFDFIIADLVIFMFLHEIWAERYTGDTSCMTSILTVFDPSNGN